MQNHAKAEPASFSTPVLNGLLQRKCAFGGPPGLTDKCADCTDKHLNVQGYAAHQSDSASAPPIVHDVLRSSGEPLDSATRGFFEPRFGHDFSTVRVHTDPRAAESARAVKAIAYTVGRNIVFAEGQHQPSTSRGRQLLAHELSHVLQQNFADSTDRPLRVEEEASSSEREADSLSQKIYSSPIAHPFHARTTALSLQRVCDNGIWTPVSNGCSVPRIAVRLLGGSHADNPAGGKDTNFSNTDKKTGPCDKHDVCYQSLSDGPGAKDRCDKQFIKDMIDVCNASTESSLKTRCYRDALRYYEGVQSIFGSIAFGKDQREIRRCLGKSRGTQKGED